LPSATFWCSVGLKDANRPGKVLLSGALRMTTGCGKRRRDGAEVGVDVGWTGSESRRNGTPRRRQRWCQRLFDSAVGGIVGGAVGGITLVGDGLIRVGYVGVAVGGVAGVVLGGMVGGTVRVAVGGTVRGALGGTVVEADGGMVGVAVGGVG
jgi:hypothetical protein